MNKLNELYYTVVGWFMLRTTRHRILKTVRKTLKDRHAMHNVLDDTERLRCAVYRYQKMAGRNNIALEESRACLD